MRRKNKRVSKIPSVKSSIKCENKDLEEEEEAAVPETNKTELSTNSIKTEEKNTLLYNSTHFKDTTFLCVELKLISIDKKCVDYKMLNKRFLCINSTAILDHLKKFIVKKMNICDVKFEVIYIQ
jgi:hypothetical protein